MKSVHNLFYGDKYLNSENMAIGACFIKKRITNALTNFYFAPVDLFKLSCIMDIASCDMLRR